MITYELHTVKVRPDGCFSVLLDPTGRPFAVTLEHTFDDGLPIIQAGMHQCNRSYYNKGQYATFEITVEGHSRILFHKGNKEADSAGCVLVAESFGELGGAAAVLDSAHGFEELMQLTNGINVFWLNVTGR